MTNEDQRDADTIESMRRRTVESLASINAALQQFNERAKSTSTIGGGLNMLEGAFGRIGARLAGVGLGGVGIAMAIRQVSSALDGMATSSLHMQTLARDTRLSAQGVESFRQTMQRWGADTATTERQIESLTSKLKELSVRRQSSNLYQELKQAPGGVEVANRLMALADKDMNAAVREAMKTVRDQDNARSKSYIADQLGISEDLAERYPELEKRNVPVTPIDPKKAEKFRDAMTTWGARWESMKNEAANMALGAANTAYDAVTGIDFAKNFREATGYKPDVPRTYNNDIPAGTDPMGEHDKGSTFPGRVWGWQNERSGIFSPDTLRRWNENPRGITDFGGMRRMQSLEEEGNKTLLEIRDTLQRMEGKGGTKFGSDYATGTRSDGAMNASGGGYRPGAAIRDAIRGSSPGVGPERGKVAAGGDPRGMESYIREAAKARGIDPDTAVAVAKSEGLLSFQSTVRDPRGPNGRENSWGAFQLYKGGGLGNEFQKATGLDPADPANEKRTIDYALDHARRYGWGAFHGAKNTGIDRWAGINRDGTTAAPGSNSDGQSPFSGMSFGGDVRERQRYVAGVRKGALDPRLRMALDYASSKTDLTVDVTSGGQRMPGAPGAIGSHRHDHGGAADFNLRDKDGKIVDPNDPRAIEFYRYAAQGGARGGGHSYMSDPSKIHLDRTGGVYAGGKAFRDAIERGQREQEEFREAARKRMDAKAAPDKWQQGSLNGKIEFLNVPNGVKTTMEGSDIFKELAISKTRQNAAPDDMPGRYGSW